MDASKEKIRQAGKSPQKTILLWLKKRCRKPKQVGLATADGSALTIFDFARMALRGDGRLYIVDAPNVSVARSKIKEYEGNKDVPERFAVPVSITNGCVIAIGERATQALRGAGESISRWEERIRTQGKVSIEQSKAIKG